MFSTYQIYEVQWLAFWMFLRVENTFISSFYCFGGVQSIQDSFPGWGALDKQEVFWRMLAPLPFASLFGRKVACSWGGSPLPSL